MHPKNQCWKLLLSSGVFQVVPGFSLEHQHLISLVFWPHMLTLKFPKAHTEL